jgi:hypothetical protein
VAESDAIGFAAYDHGAKEVQTQTASFLLEIPGLAYRSVVDRAGKIETGSEFRNKGSIGIGFGAAEVVVHVKHTGGEPEILKRVEQADRVGATGNSDCDTAPG